MILYLFYKQRIVHSKTTMNLARKEEKEEEGDKRRMAKFICRLARRDYRAKIKGELP